MKKRLVLIGNGMAGIRTLEELLKRAPDKYQITVFGSEPYPNYNRIQLSYLLAGECGINDIITNSEQWYLDNNINLHTNSLITSIDTNNKFVIASDGSCYEYDDLIIATGSTPFVPPIAGVNLDGVVCFRSIEDVEQMITSAGYGGKAVVIGGGLLGLEAADGLLKQGMDVTVIHLNDHLMDAQLDSSASRLLKVELEARGLKFEMGTRTESLLGDKCVSGVKLSDSRVLDANLVVVCTGIRPNTEIAFTSGIAFDQGIIVGDGMQTSCDNVFAVGECVQHDGRTFGLVAPLYEQAKVLAKNLADQGPSLYTCSETSTRLKVNGIDLFSAGVLAATDLGANDADEIILNDPINKSYKKLVIAENKIKGVVLYGNTQDGAWLFQLLKDEADISDLYEQLLYGQGYSSNGVVLSAADRMASLPDDTEVCGCNGISKGEVVSAITGQNCDSIEKIRAHTTASASCGSCTDMVEAVLECTLGDTYDAAAAKQGICSCTSCSHEDVRQAIKEQSLKTIPQITKALGWKHVDGCHNCRQALNFYLLVAWPGEYEDDPLSRHINERVHANIQKDGTYAVIPRIWGGLTNAAELKALGDIAEKYGTPAKITGGQRIALAGVTKEQLPLIWKDMNDAGFVSGHAYGKALRSVKTCVGDLLCNYGIRDSIPLGIEIEKMAWGAWTPHKVKMGVSGCPRNCAEATIKDIGFVATEAGWEVYVGGNGGAKAKVAEYLTRLNNSEEAKRFSAAFLQLCREEGRYKERTADWIARIGMDYLVQRLVEDKDGCKALEERFLFAMVSGQFDPWKKEVENENQSEYQTIKLTEIA